MSLEPPYTRGPSLESSRTPSSTAESRDVSCILGQAVPVAEDERFEVEGRLRDHYYVDGEHLDATPYGRLLDR